MRKYVLIVGGILVAIGVAALVLRKWPTESATARKPTSETQETDYITSVNCKECHLSEFHSWHDSYHRTMTQRATVDTVIAPIDDITVHSRGRDYRFYKKGDQFRVQMVDPDWEIERLRKGLSITQTDNPPVIDRQIMMTTGSHHYQAYWINGRLGNEFRQVPFVYHIATDQWVPREDAFLQRSSQEREFALWNNNCVLCHTVGGRPGFDVLKNTWQTSFVELGIACEACHGPGRKHAELHRSKTTASATNAQDLDQHIVNPARLDKDRAAAVCGQCHADFYPKDSNDSFKNGYADSFRPGRLLEESRVIMSYQEARNFSDKREIGQGLDAGESLYWKDGAVRVGGREYNGLVESACFQKGEITCLSCHSMHNYQEPDDQLARNRNGNDTCLECHTEYSDRISEHTHHAPASSGSLCYNCHMPHTSYALFKAIRSHRIDSPNSQSFVQSGRPNACNLCHLDQTLKWTVDHIHEWYDQPVVTLDDDSQHITASILWILKGDAAQRAIVGWSAGWSPAHSASGKDWSTPFIAELMADPYAAIRFISARTLEKLDAELDPSFDFVGPPEEWRSQRDKLIKNWQRTSEVSNPDRFERLLLDSKGVLQRSEIDRLLRLRDNRRIVIGE